MHISFIGLAAYSSPSRKGRVMSTAGTRMNVFETITDEHHELELLFACVAEAVSRGPSDVPGLSVLLDNLVGRIERHFVREEADGYFTEIVELAPRFARVAVELQREHADLLMTAKRLCGRLPIAQESHNSWRVFQLDFEAFVQRCAEHESAENRLVQETYLQDIGALD